MVEHKIKISEEVKLTMEIPEEITLDNLKVITQNFENITRVFIHKEKNFRKHFHGKHYRNKQNRRY